MICTKCGKEILKGDRFCQGCGEAAPVWAEEVSTCAETTVHSSTEAKKAQKISVPLMILAIAALCLIVAGGLFKTQILSFTYTKLAEVNFDKNPEKAIYYAEKAYKLDNDSTQIAKLYTKKAEKILDKNPGQAIELLLKAKGYINDNSLNTLIANAYLKDAEKKIKYDIDGAISQIDESTKYESSPLTNELYAQAYVAKADKTALSNVDEGIDYIKLALEYKQSDEIKKKIITLYLKKAELMLNHDINAAIDFANEAKFYGNDSRIAKFIQGANSRLQAAIGASSGYETEAQKLDSLIYNYTKALAEAVNYGDFSIIEPYLVYDSNLYNMQEDFVVNSYNNNMKEEFVNAYIKNYEYDPMNNLYKVYVYEEYNIAYASGTVENKGYDWVYTARLQPEYGLMDISK